MVVLPVVPPVLVQVPVLAQAPELALALVQLEPTAVVTPVEMVAPVLALGVASDVRPHCLHSPHVLCATDGDSI